MFTTVGLIVSLLIFIAVLSFTARQLDLLDAWAKYRTWLALTRKYNTSSVEVSFFTFCRMNTAAKNVALYNWLATNLQDAEIANLQRSYSRVRNSVNAYGDHKIANLGVRPHYQYDWILRCLPHRLLAKQAKIG